MEWWFLIILIILIAFIPTIYRINQRIHKLEIKLDEMTSRK